MLKSDDFSYNATNMMMLAHVCHSPHVSGGFPSQQVQIQNQQRVLEHRHVVGFASSWFGSCEWQVDGTVSRVLYSCRGGGQRSRVSSRYSHQDYERVSRKMNNEKFGVAASAVCQYFGREGQHQRDCWYAVKVDKGKDKKANAIAQSTLSITLEDHERCMGTS